MGKATRVGIPLSGAAKEDTRKGEGCAIGYAMVGEKHMNAREIAGLMAFEQRKSLRHQKVKYNCGLLGGIFLAVGVWLAGIWIYTMVRGWF